MKLLIPKALLESIHQHGERAYPEEGAGFLLGTQDADTRQVKELIPLSNSREDDARHNRYLLTAKDMLYGETEAQKRGLDVVGVFHSHPDHPNQPSEFDREWALPWFSYLITSVANGQTAGSRSWRLEEDRSGFREEEIELID